MPDDRLGFWDYAHAAFHLKTRVPLLGHLALNKWALAGFAILGFGSPAFWLLGLGLETAYLLYLTGNQRFQKVVQSRRMAGAHRAWMEKEQDALLRLSVDSRRRYEDLVARCQAIMRAEEAFDTSGSLTSMKWEGLGQLLPMFLKLLALQKRINDSRSSLRREDLEQDIRRLQESLSRQDQGAAVRRSLEGTLQIQQARLDNLDKSTEQLMFIETELERIEKQVSLIAEQMTVNKTPEQWSVALDGVIQSIQGATQWMSENAHLLETIDAPSVPVERIKPQPERPAPAKSAPKRGKTVKITRRQEPPQRM